MIPLANTFYNSQYGALQIQYNVENGSVYLKIAKPGGDGSDYKYDWKNTLVVTVWDKSVQEVYISMYNALKESNIYTYKYKNKEGEKSVQFGVTSGGKCAIALTAGTEKRSYVFYDINEAKYFVSLLEKFDNNSLVLKLIHDMLSDDGAKPTFAEKSTPPKKKAPPKRNVKSESDDDPFAGLGDGEEIAESSDSLLDDLLI